MEIGYVWEQIETTCSIEFVSYAAVDEGLIAELSRKLILQQRDQNIQMYQMFVPNLLVRYQGISQIIHRMLLLYKVSEDEAVQTLKATSLHVSPKAKRFPGISWQNKRSSRL